MAMNPFDNAKGMGDLWSRGAQSFVDTQRNLFEAMTQGMSAQKAEGAPRPMPDAQSFQAAQAAFQQAWTNAQSVSAAFTKSLGGEGEKPDPIAAQIMAKIFDPRGWLSATSEVDEALNRMAEGPRLADLWSVERKFGELMTAWLALRRRNLEHNTVMLEAWSAAAGQFSKAVNERAEKGEPLESARALMALWVEIANDSLLETQRGEGFLKSQRDTLKASTDLRLAQQEIGEYYSTMFGYPTRAELDDVHKTVTELRREVRTLARAARSRNAPAPAAKAAPEKAAPATTVAAKVSAAKPSPAKAATPKPAPAKPVKRKPPAPAQTAPAQTAPANQAPKRAASGKRSKAGGRAP